jgi:predicted nucleic acid-binding protein
MARLVLTDASPLIGLTRVDGPPWLGALFGVVWMPPEVRREVLPDRGHPDAGAILAAQTADWLRETGPAPVEPPLPDLDEGEAACIRIALANAGPSQLLMHARGLRVADTAAIIGLAEQRGLIASARGVFVRLHASDFRISAQVIATVLARVGE